MALSAVDVGDCVEAWQTSVHVTEKLKTATYSEETGMGVSTCEFIEGAQGMAGYKVGFMGVSIRTGPTILRITGILRTNSWDTRH